MDKLFTFLVGASAGIVSEFTYNAVGTYLAGLLQGEEEEEDQKLYKCDVIECPAKHGKWTVMSADELDQLSKLCVRHKEPFSNIESCESPRVCNFCRQLIKTLCSECCKTKEHNLESKYIDMDFYNKFGCILCSTKLKPNNAHLCKFERKLMRKLCPTHLTEPYFLLTPDAMRFYCVNHNHHARKAIKDCCCTNEVYSSCHDIELFEPSPNTSVTHDVCKDL